jgi:hypothetical protein
MGKLFKRSAAVQVIEKASPAKAVAKSLKSDKSSENVPKDVKKRENARTAVAKRRGRTSLMYDKDRKKTLG